MSLRYRRSKSIHRNIETKKFISCPAPIMPEKTLPIQPITDHQVGKIVTPITEITIKVHLPFYAPLKTDRVRASPSKTLVRAREVVTRPMRGRAASVVAVPLSRLRALVLSQEDYGGV